MYRPGKQSVAADSHQQQLEQLRTALSVAESEAAALQQDLVAEKSRGRQRHVQLVEDLTKTLQARDAALSALRRLEKFCSERGVDIKGLAIYEVSAAARESPLMLLRCYLSYRRSNPNSLLPARMDRGGVRTTRSPAAPPPRSSSEPCTR